MHIPKLLLVTAFVAAAGASSLFAQRPDSDAQARARAALDAAMNAPAETAPSNTLPPAPAVMPKPVPAPKPPPAQAPVATAPAQPVTQAPAENSQQLLRPVPVASTPPPTKPAPASVPASHRVQPMSPLSVPETAPASTLTPEELRRAEQVLHNPAEATPAMPPPTPASANGTPAMTTPPAGTGPAQMPSAADSQEARLGELLLLYQNDQITPAEYQARRAKILSGK